MSPALPAGAGLIALSGLVPLLLMAGALPFAPAGWKPALTDGVIAYAAVTAGFLGGVRWGAELARAPARPHLPRLAGAGLMTMPAFAALLLMAHRPVALLLLVLAGIGQLMWDLAAAHAGLLPAWTFRLRIALTLIGAACLGVAAAYGM